MIESFSRSCFEYLVWIACLGVFSRGWSRIPFLGRASAFEGWLLLLFASLIGGLGGSAGLWTGSVLFAAVACIGLPPVFGWKRKKLRESSVPALLFLGFSAYWLWQFRDLAALPSTGDGIHHLFYFSRILETGQVFSGKIPLRFETLFGPQALDFYPTGSHALIAILTSPLRWIFDTIPLTQIKLGFVFFLALIPSLLWTGARKTFPSVRISAITFAALMAGSIALFPFPAAGEGGLSRVVGAAMSLPVAWRLLRASTGPRTFIFTLAFVFPTLFFIHPSSIFVPGLIWVIRLIQLARAGRVKFRHWFATGIAGVYCASMLWLWLKTGQQVITEGAVLEKFAHLQSFSGGALFDRIKGPIHYLLSDPFGFGKFLSPRSLAVYFALFIVAKRSRSLEERGLSDLRWLIPALLLLPLAMSLLIFMPLAPARMLGMIFYHDVKRFAELGYLALFLSWMLVLDQLRPWLVRAGAILVCGIIAAVALPKGGALFEEMNRLYGTPRRGEVLEAVARVESQVPPSARIACRAPTPQLLVSIPSLRDRFQWVTIGTECGASVRLSAHCQSRLNRIREVEGQGKPLELPWEKCAFLP